MSIVIASTTDTQAQVNEAAGITSGTPAVPSPEQAPSEVSEPEQPDDSEPSEDEPDEQDDSAERKPRRSASAQQRIARLTRDKYQLAGRLQELERRLNEGLPPRQDQPTPQTRQPPAGEPRQEDFPDDYEAFNTARTQWLVAQALLQERRQREAERAEEQETRQLQAWRGNLQKYRAETPDFEAVMQGAEDIRIPGYLQREIMSYEEGPALAYELAKNPEALERIVSLPRDAAFRELGRFEARQNIGQRKPPSPVSKAPEPISPVGRGSSTSTRDPGEMSFQDFKRWRLKNGAR